MERHASGAACQWSGAPVERRASGAACQWSGMASAGDAAPVTLRGVSRKGVVGRRSGTSCAWMELRLQLRSPACG